MNLGHETERVEFKRSTSELREGMESIASILNKHGAGELYFGVRTDGEVVGQAVSEKTLRDVSQAVGNRIEPRIYPIIEDLKDEIGNTYLRVTFEGHEPPYACDGRYRIRSADEDVPMAQEELARQFAYARARKVPWDTWESERPIGDVDEDELRAYVARGNECGRIAFSFTSVENVLSRLSLIRNGKLTNAAEVLFCPSSTFQLSMGLLADHARTDILDLHHEQGTLFSLVRAAEHYILVNTRRRFVIDDYGPRKEIPELPKEAVREILFNAYCHRDWLSQARVQVDIYHDAVEITNPGWFIEGQDPKEHLAGDGGSSLSRNMLIAQALYRSGDIEAYGSGIPRVRNACKEAGVQIEYVRVSVGTKFVFHRNDAFADASDVSVTDNETINAIRETANERDETVTETLKGVDETKAERVETINEAQADSHEIITLTDDEQRIVDVMKSHPDASYEALADLVGFSRAKVGRLIQRLRNLQVVNRVGARKNGRWEIVQ